MNRETPAARADIGTARMGQAALTGNLALLALHPPADPRPFINPLSE